MHRMAALYEDNFGYWDVAGPAERAFFAILSPKVV